MCVCVCVCVCKEPVSEAMVGAGSAAKKAGKRRISFRPQNSDSNIEQDSVSQQEEEVEQAGADDAEDTMLSADNIEEDEEPEPAAPLSSEACHQRCLLSLHREPLPTWTTEIHASCHSLHIRIIRIICGSSSGTIRIHNGMLNRINSFGCWV